MFEIEAEKRTENCQEAYNRGFSDGYAVGLKEGKDMNVAIGSNCNEQTNEKNLGLENNEKRFEKIINLIALLFLFLIFSALSVILCKIDIYLLDKINVVFIFLLAGLALFFIAGTFCFLGLLFYVIFDKDFLTDF